MTGEPRIGKGGGARWVIVLSGGEGERLRPLVQSWLGCHRPKQYCAFTGGKTMLDHTLARAGRVAPSERVITVIGKGHRRFIEEDGAAGAAGKIVEQPSNLDTAPGIFLPALHILLQDPEATVLILPSDHYIASEDGFARCSTEALELAELRQDRIVLLGAVPDAPEEDYGWIEPEAGPTTGGRPSPVARFREKPGRREALSFFEKGYLWNTMIMAVKIRTLWELGRRCLPDMMESLEPLRAALGAPVEAAALEAVYAGMRPANFSTGILERASRRATVLPKIGRAHV
jgi:mannose-1-phosphate guanylyltransferase